MHMRRAIKTLYQALSAVSLASWVWGLPYAAFAAGIAGVWADMSGLPLPISALVASGFGAVAYLFYVAWRVHRIYTRQAHAVVPAPIVEPPALEPAATPGGRPNVDEWLADKENRLVELEQERDRALGQIDEIEHYREEAAKGWDEIREVCAIMPEPLDGIGLSAIFREKRHDIDLLHRAATDGCPAGYPVQVGPVGQGDSQDEMPDERRRIAYRQVVTAHRVANEAAANAVSQLRAKIDSLERKISLLKNSK